MVGTYSLSEDSIRVKIGMRVKEKEIRKSTPGIESRNLPMKILV